MSDHAAPEERTFTQPEVDRIVGDRLARDRQTRARVVSEPRTYGLTSPHSFFADAATVAVPTGITTTGASERLAAHAGEVAHEIEARSAEGRRAERIIRELTRVQDASEHRRRADRLTSELRALTTGGGASASAATSASVLVSPYFLLDETALFRGVARSFADQCHLLPLPEWGMEVYVPYFSTTDAAGQQTEGSAVTETDPTTSFQGSAVVNITGQITATQQLLDRGARGGGTVDVLIQRQLQQQLEEKLDLYVLTTVIGNAGTFAGAASLTANSFKEVYADIAKGREGITDTAGTRLRPTHFFTTSDLYSGLTNIMGTDGRPMVLPASMPGFPVTTGADDSQNRPKWSRFTGTVLPGNVLWFCDDNIAVSGSNNQLIVSAPDQSVVLLESPEPTFTVFPQTAAGDLEVLLNLRSYACAITRYPSGTQVYTGAGYPTTLK